MVKSPAGHLQVQVVLFKNDLPAIWRLMWGVTAAVRQAAAEFDLTATLAFGDCSPVPVLRPEDTEALRREAVEAGLEDLGYIYFNDNLGSSGGSNRLAEQSESDLILVLNPDTYPVPNMLRILIRALDDADIGVAEARHIPLEHPKAYHPVTGDTSWASGCCLLVRREVFRAVGGFDHDHFPLYCDDVDFSWRVRLAGYRVVHVPRAVVFHGKQMTLSGGPVPASTEVYHGTLGRLMLATRYSRPDILAETMSSVSAAGDPVQKQALADFEARRAEGRVPAPIEDASRVAEFVGGEYAQHRF
ncbi:MAG TPA: glycosyltransferase family 2 protein [Actinomycetota bacterium]|nr:glycosyltransferase family 2 protein [Actinomycetota bacterium]